jgi:hypothetical protein
MAFQLPIPSMEKCCHVLKKNAFSLHQFFIYQLHLFSIKQVCPIVKIPIPHFVGNIEIMVIKSIVDEPPIDIQYRKISIK